MPDRPARDVPPPAEPPRDVHVYNESSRGGGPGPGLVFGLVAVVLLVAALWFMFGRGGGTVVPDRIDVDVNLPQAPAPRTPDPAPAQPAPQPPAQPAPGTDGGS
jgi:hypothetical protein